MGRVRSPKAFGLAGLFIAVACFPAAVHSQQIHRNGFESLQTSFTKGAADAAYDVTSHVMSDQGAHLGKRSENIQFTAKQGSFIYYQYSVGKAPLNDELAGSLWIKGNRPGVQLMSRIVLPKERDPNNLQQPLTTVIRGDVYQNVGRWQRLSMGRPLALAKQQQQLLQASLKRQVDFTDAYVDAFLVNVYCGPGATEVWIDDLEVGPTIAPANTPTPPPVIDPSNPTSPPQPVAKGRIVEFKNGYLLVGGKKHLFLGVRHTDTPIRPLRDAGFNTVFVDYSTPGEILKEAGDLGVWVVPQIRVLSDDARMSSPEGIAKEVSRYSENDSILFWHLGGTLAFEQAQPIARAAQAVRQADPGRPVGADVWDGLMPYSRTLNLVGVHRWPLMTTLELPKYREWLVMRQRLMNPGTFMWTWVQTHIPDWHSQILYERGAAAAFSEPVGPQPEQIRLLMYQSVAAGARGLGYWSDRFLADSHSGRDRLLMCGLLNQEMEMLEPLLVTVDDPPVWIDTSSPDVKAAVLRTAKGVLVIPIWQGKGAQFVPGQAAVAGLSVVVPQVPQSMQAWEVLPGDVRALKVQRVVGGTKVTLPEFGLTTALVFTSDNDTVIRFQHLSRNRRERAAQWTYDMAAYEMDKILKVEAELERMGHTLPDGQGLIQDAHKRLAHAKQLWESRQFSESFRESERGLRPLRILMREQWDCAVKGLDSPVSSPYAVSFFTLPKHWAFMDIVRSSSPGPNLLFGGDFEIVPERKQDGWKIEELTLDDVELLAQRVGQIEQPMDLSKNVPTTVDFPREGKQCAMLQVRPKKKDSVPLALERTLLSLTSAPVKLQPGTLVAVSAWVRIPEKIGASVDGAIFYDSAGGEPFAVRLTDPTPWKKITLFRKVPASGQISVSVALTGLGTVYFDDVRVEPLTPTGEAIRTVGAKQ